MYSQIIKLDNGKIKLYINTSKEQHDWVITSLTSQGFRNDSQIDKKSDKVYDVWFLYQDDKFLSKGV